MDLKNIKVEDLKELALKYSDKKTLIKITHRLFTIENCDKVFFIEKGKIVKEGKPKDIL